MKTQDHTDVFPDVKNVPSDAQKLRYINSSIIGVYKKDSKEHWLSPNQAIPIFNIWDSSELVEARIISKNFLIENEHLIFGKKKVDLAEFSKLHSLEEKRDILQDMRFYEEANLQASFPFGYHSAKIKAFGVGLQKEDHTHTSSSLLDLYESGAVNIRTVKYNPARPSLDVNFLVPDKKGREFYDPVSRKKIKLGKKVAIPAFWLYSPNITNDRRFFLMQAIRKKLIRHKKVYLQVSGHEAAAMPKAECRLPMESLKDFNENLLISSCVQSGKAFSHLHNEEGWDYLELYEKAQDSAKIF